MKRFILGFLCGTLLFGGVSSLAQNEIIQAVLSDIKVQLNGSQMQLNDPVIVYNDKTYVPVRQIAEAIGKEVSFDDTSRTVLIGNVSTPPPFKMTSDGLYSTHIGNNVYSIKSFLISEKYKIGRDVSIDHKHLIFYVGTKSNSITVNAHFNDGVICVYYSDYEDIILPFINEN